MILQKYFSGMIFAHIFYGVFYMVPIRFCGKGLLWPYNKSNILKNKIVIRMNPLRIFSAAHTVMRRLQP